MENRIKNEIVMVYFMNIITEKKKYKNGLFSIEKFNKFVKTVANDISFSPDEIVKKVNSFTTDILKGSVKPVISMVSYYKYAYTHFSNNELARIFDTKPQYMSQGGNSFNPDKKCFLNFSDDVCEVFDIINLKLYGISKCLK